VEEFASRRNISIKLEGERKIDQSRLLQSHLHRTTSPAPEPTVQADETPPEPERTATEDGGKPQSSDDEDEEGGAKASSSKVNLRRRHGRRMIRSKVKRRKSMINGHCYDVSTSTFTPPRGCVASVWVTSLVTATEVVNMLLEKYKVLSPAENFGLYAIWDHGG
jgi:hypothetical protein